MTAFGVTARPTLEPEGRSWSPSEGWSAVALLGIALVAVAVAVDDSRWVGTYAGGQSQTAYLPAVILAGAAWGFIGAKSRLPTLAVHVIGALLGTALVLALVAGVGSSAPDLRDRLADLSAALDRFVGDILVRGRRSSETSAFLVAVGLIAWATGAFTAFAVFRRHRPLDALVIAGLLLLLDLSLTYQQLFSHLVVFAAAALLLLVRTNLVEQRSGWARRRIGDAGHVSGLFMRSGLSFVAVALIVAVMLTTFGSSAPLAGFWRGSEGDILKIGQTLNRLVGGITAPARGPNSLFASDQTIQSLWVSSPEVAFTAATPDKKGYYWRAGTYDQFDGRTWHQSDRWPTTVAAGDRLYGATSEGVSPETRREVTATITAVRLSGDLVLSPEEPEFVEGRTTTVITNGDGGPFAAAEFTDGLADGESYTLHALVRDEDRDRGLTQNRLAVPSTQVYPTWVTDHYAADPGAAVGEGTRRIAAEIVATLPPERRTSAYYIAQAMQDYLGGADTTFEYSVDVRGQCEGGDVIDCFLVESKQGFCMQFASAMAMLLRVEGIPARLAMGYLPGTRLEDGTYRVDKSAAHAWVEVYFTGYGWVAFDPTPGNTDNGRRLTRLPVGAAIPSPGAGASSSARPRGSFGINEPRGGQENPGRPLPPPPGGVGGGWLAVVLIGLLALGLVIGAVSARERRRPTPAPDALYRGVARLAGRFGYGPRPTQTAYEYATALGEVVPAAREELAMVARAKVETTYGHRLPEPEAMVALRGAYRHLRVRLLALAFRRRGRPGGRSPTLRR